MQRSIGLGNLASQGSEAAYYGYQGLQLFNAFRAADALATGIDQVANGNNWGYLGIAGGTLGLAGSFSFANSYAQLNTFGTQAEQVTGFGSQLVQEMDGAAGGGGDLRSQILANISANQQATANISQGLITMDLRALTSIAAQDVDSQGALALTLRQQIASAIRPSLWPMYRGTAIDGIVREQVAQDPFLSDLEGFSNRGPDFSSAAIPGVWWDMTTPAQWAAHVAKYGAGGILLPTQ